MLVNCFTMYAPGLGGYVLGLPSWGCSLSDWVRMLKPGKKLVVKHPGGICLNFYTLSFRLFKQLVIIGKYCHILDTKNI